MMNQSHLDLEKQSFLKIGAFGFVRRLLGGILLIAATLKGYSLLSDGPANSLISMALLTEFEFIFGLWLLTSLAPRASWVACLLIFGSFAGIAVAKMWLNAGNCGCIGKNSLPPWVAAAIDLAALILLAAFPPNALRFSHPDLVRQQLWFVATSWLLLGLPWAIAIIFGIPVLPEW